MYIVLQAFKTLNYHMTIINTMLRVLGDVFDI